MYSPMMRLGALDRRRPTVAPAAQPQERVDARGGPRQYGSMPAFSAWNVMGNQMMSRPDPMGFVGQAEDGAASAAADRPGLIQELRRWRRARR